MLGRVERRVGPAHRRLETLPRPGRREADADRDADRPALGGDGIRRHGGPDALGDRRPVLGPGLDEQDREFLAPEPPDRVEGAERRAAGGDEGDQRRVAGGVAVAVVDELEPVEVEHQQAGILPGAARPVAGADLQEAPAGQRPGERIGIGEPAQLRLQAGAGLDLARQGLVERLQVALLLSQALVGLLEVGLHPVAQAHQPALLAVAPAIGLGQHLHPVRHRGELGQHHLGPVEDGLLVVEQAEDVGGSPGALRPLAALVRVGLGQAGFPGGRAVGRRHRLRTPSGRHAAVSCTISNRACEKSAEKSSPASAMVSSPSA